MLRGDFGSIYQCGGKSYTKTGGLLESKNPRPTCAVKQELISKVISYLIRSLINIHHLLPKSCHLKKTRANG